jgi:hypothetical protein
LKSFIEIRIRTIEQIVPVVVVMDQMWLQIPDIEKVPFLLREIGQKIKKKQ